MLYELFPFFFLFFLLKGSHESVALSLYIPVTAMGKCEQDNSSSLQYRSDILLLIIHERNDFANAMVPTLKHS